MAEGSGKLVNSLAESLVNELGKSKSLDLMNDEKFSEFTDLLNDISKKLDKKEDEKADDKEKNKEEENKKDKEKEKKKESFKDAVFKKKLKTGKTDSEKIIDMLDSMPKNIKKELKGIDTAAEKRAIKMTRSIKKTIKSRIGKLWSIFKKLLVVGLLLFFAPILKNAFTKMKDALISGINKFKEFTEPVWKPFIDWFKTEFPKVTTFLGEMVEYVKKIGGAIKKIADGISKLVEWKDEHPNLTAGITAGVAGASVGLMFGPLGMLIGGVGGFLLGVGANAIRDALKGRDENEEKELTADDVLIEKVISKAKDKSLTKEDVEAIETNKNVLQDALLNYIAVKRATDENVGEDDIDELSKIVRLEARRLSVPTELSSFVDQAKQPKPVENPMPEDVEPATPVNEFIEEQSNEKKDEESKPTAFQNINSSSQINVNQIYLGAGENPWC